jgi:hypothetical protein
MSESRRAVIVFAHQNATLARFDDLGAVASGHEIHARDAVVHTLIPLLSLSPKNQFGRTGGHLMGCAARAGDALRSLRNRRGRP